MNNRSTISVLAFHNDSHTHAKELFQDADVDAIYVPLPTAIRKPVGIMSLVFQGKRQNRLHVFQLLMCMQWVLKAANAKKHVLCEKPVAPNAADALEMIRACRNNGEGCMSIASPNATLVQSIEMQARKINSTRLALILYVQMCCLWTTRCSCTTLGSRPCPRLCMTRTTTSTGYLTGGRDLLYITYNRNIDICRGFGVSNSLACMDVLIGVHQFVGAFKLFVPGVTPTDNADADTHTHIQTLCIDSKLDA